MATFFQSVRQGFGRGSNKNTTQKTSPQPSPTYTSPNMPSLTSSASFSSIQSAEGHYNNDSDYKRFFNEKYAKCSVKGNFLTLAAQPKNVELGEWLAHQLVEMNRLLTGMLQVIQEVDTNTGLPVCNEHTCPTMSAGRLTYTWLENGRPAKIPAPSYIIRVQKWIVGKIQDPRIFPTDPPTGIAQTAYVSGDLSGTSSGPGTPSTPIAMPPTNLNSSVTSLAGANDQWIGKASGFPRNFHQDCKSIIKQMFRCYAHLYHNHFDNPFWHINRHLELNSCFVHFVTVAMFYDLIAKKDMEPLQPLIDIFIKEKVIPLEAVQKQGS